MGDKSLIHDTAWAGSAAVVHLFSGCLREEEKVTAFHEVYELLKAALERFVTQRDRERSRLGRPRAVVPEPVKGEPHARSAGDSREDASRTASPGEPTSLPTE